MFWLVSTISASFCVCAWFIINLLLPLERNEGLLSLSPASSRTCQVGLFLLHAITAKGWHSPTGSRMQQVLSSIHVLVVGRGLSGHTAYSTAPPGANVSDVQVGIHVDLCHSPSTSAGSAQGRRSTGSVPTQWPTWIAITSRSNSRVSSASRISRSSGALFPSPKSLSRWGSSPQ